MKNLLTILLIIAFSTPALAKNTLIYTCAPHDNQGPIGYVNLYETQEGGFSVSYSDLSGIPTEDLDVVDYGPTKNGFYMRGERKTPFTLVIIRGEVLTGRFQKDSKSKLQVMACLDVRKNRI